MPINRKLYPADWRAISNRIRFERAGGKCEWCGAVHSQPHPVTGSLVVLTTAHIDQKLTDHSDDNLAALCQRCHLNYDRACANYSRRYGKEYRKNNYKLNL